MRILTGDECGLLKEFVPSQVKSQQQPDGGVDATAAAVILANDRGLRRVNPMDPMARRHAVVGLTWMPELRHFAALRVDGTVQVWEGTYEPNQSGTYRLNVELPDVFSSAPQKPQNNDNDDNDDDESVSIQRRAIGIHSWSMHNRLVACDTAGLIAVVNPFASEQDDCVVNTFEAYSSTKNNVNNKDNNNNNKTSKDTPILCTAFCLNEQDGVVAVGAKGREMVLCDITTGKAVWKAKNLSPDPQTLLQPRVWPTAACFFSNQNSSNLLAVGSAYHQVRIYDVRTSSSSSTSNGVFVPQRRPIQYTDEKNTYLEHRITALCPLGTSHELAVGDAGGGLLSLDLRQLSGGANVTRSPATPVLGRFVGPAGSVRQLLYQPENNRLVCVGLDRMLRVYHATTRRPLQTVYLKQRLQCVLVSEELLESEENDNDDNDDDDDDNDDDGIDQEDNVQDYVDSDEDSESDDEHRAVVEQMDEVFSAPSSSDEDDDDDGGDGSSVEAERLPSKRRRK